MEVPNPAISFAALSCAIRADAAAPRAAAQAQQVGDFWPAAIRPGWYSVIGPPAPRARTHALQLR